MAERDMTPVTIHLDQARPYRDRDTMVVTTIGPGPVTIPKFVADRWGYATEDKFEDAAKAVSEPAPLAEPWPGYSTLHVDEVRQLLRPLSPDEREAVRAFEMAKGKDARKGILNVLKALAEESAA